MCSSLSYAMNRTYIKKKKKKVWQAESHALCKFMLACILLHLYKMMINYPWLGAGFVEIIPPYLFPSEATIY